MYIAIWFSAKITITTTTCCVCQLSTECGAAGADEVLLRWERTC